MHTLHADRKADGAGLGTPCWGFSHPPIARHVTVICLGRPPSLPAGGRSLRGGCAARRQTGARGLAAGPAHCLAIRPTRHLAGRFFASSGELLNFAALVRAGIGERFAAAVVNPQSAHHACQDRIEPSEHHVDAASIALRYVQTVARGSEHDVTQDRASGTHDDR